MIRLLCLFRVVTVNKSVCWVLERRMRCVQRAFSFLRHSENLRRARRPNPPLFGPPPRRRVACRVSRVASRFFFWSYRSASSRQSVRCQNVLYVLLAGVAGRSRPTLSTTDGHDCGRGIHTVGLSPVNGIVVAWRWEPCERPPSPPPSNPSSASSRKGGGGGGARQSGVCPMATGALLPISPYI